jgi:multidrug transporter EmrE-like cation transporter
VGNASGFLGVLALTLAMRVLPLSQAVALSWGLGFVAVQIVGAHFIFRETITLLQWLGVALVTGGIVLISLGRAS